MAFKAYCLRETRVEHFRHDFLRKRNWKGEESLGGMNEANERGDM